MTANYYKTGQIIKFNNQDCKILEILDLLHIYAVEIKTKKLRIIAVEEMNGEITTLEDYIDLDSLTERDWAIAKKRYMAIKPMLNVKPGEKEVYLRQSEKAGKHSVTLYRWCQKYRKTGRLSSLLPQKKGPKPNVTKLDESVEEIIVEVINEKYLKKDKVSVISCWEEVAIKCRNRGLTQPHLNTFRNRVRQISEYQRMKSREGFKQAQEEFAPIMGHLSAETPLEIVQIDHTPIDLILVDNEYRKPIGRPYLTIAFDVCTRMVVGYYISFDPVGSVSTGVCISHSIMRKSQYLAKLKVDADWPCWGIPDCIHVDNAKEFRGNMLNRACKEYDIQIHWRPVKTPNWGGHIERCIGTLNNKLHDLPGTTFSNIFQRKNYKSEKKATLTIEEFERYFAILVLKVYHHTPHSSLGKPPIQMWKEKILGNEETRGCGLPRAVTDENKLQLDFMPYVMRTINEYGILIDGVHYYHDVLRPLIKSREPDKYMTRKKFLFRRDPRDISVIYLWDPESSRYHEIPYRNTSRAPMSLWELKELKRKIAADTQGKIDENQLFKAHEEMRKITDNAKKEKMKTRRKKARRKFHHKEAIPKQITIEPNHYEEDSVEDLSLSDLDNYTDLEVL